MNKVIGFHQIVYWQYARDTNYLYGSELTYLPNGHVRIENAYMPSGKEFQRWTSRLHYQANREVAPLPQLIAGRVYNVRINAQVQPAQTVVAMIEFFDIRGQVIDTLPITALNIDFVYPSAAYYYEIVLLSGGGFSLEFESLEIMERTQDYELEVDSERIMMTDWLNRDEVDEAFTIIFMEPKSYGFDEVFYNSIKQYPNLRIIKSLIAWQSHYLDEITAELIATLMTLINQLVPHASVTFVGYGPVSLQAAYHFKALYDDTSQVLDLTCRQDETLLQAEPLIKQLSYYSALLGEQIIDRKVGHDA